MRQAFRRAQLDEAWHFLTELASTDDKTLYPEVQERLLGLAYLISAVSDELEEWNHHD